MEDIELNLSSFEDVEEALVTIMQILGKLLAVLHARNLITSEDKEYICGVLSEEDWTKHITRSPYDMFMELLKSAETTKPDIPNDKETGGTDQ